MTSPTVGPADTNAGARAKLYAGLAFITPVLSALSAFNIITTTQGSAVATFLSAAIGLLGAFGFGLAATKTKQQVDNGTFEPAPAAAPVTNAFEALGQIKAEVENTIEQAQTHLANGIGAIQAAASLVPGGSVSGAVSNAVFSGPVGDLIQAMSDRTANVPSHRREE